VAKQNGFWRIIGLANSERGVLAGATLALVCTASLNLAYPQLIRLIIDRVKPGGDSTVVDTYVLGLFALFVCVSLITAARMYLFEIAGERIVMRLRQALFEALIRQDVAFFDQNKSGALLNRLSADTTVVQNAATVNLSMALRFSLAAIGSLIILSFTSIELTIVMLGVVPPAVIGTRIYGRWIKKLSTKVQDQLAITTGIAEESLTGVRTIRAFNAEDHIDARFHEGINIAFETARRRARRIASFGALAGFAGYAAVCGVLWYGGHLYVESKLTLGELTSFMLYTFTVAFSIGALGTVWQSFMKATGASQRVFEVIDNAIEVKSGDVTPSSPFELIEFNTVDFTYPARLDMPVLASISFSLRRGKQIAIVGPSGAGKSTIAALLTRLYDPTAGQISVNHHELKTLDLSWWRAQFGVVFQEATLFAYSIRNNLLLGQPGASDTLLWRALESAQLAEFVHSLPLGLDTEIGEKGVQLSGGQRQRMAIARLLVKDPPLVILDEATSALDTSTEAKIKAALGALLKDRTALIIAHRLSTVIDADEILYVAAGKILAKGQHEVLLETCPEYAKLVEAQIVFSDA
jgi:ABC-type multidrug transport system fused ATPase/permease subunit